jgi:hypothetical protein
LTQQRIPQNPAWPGALLPNPGGPPADANYLRYSEVAVLRLIERMTPATIHGYNELTVQRLIETMIYDEKLEFLGSPTCHLHSDKHNQYTT